MLVLIAHLCVLVAKNKPCFLWPSSHSLRTCFLFCLFVVPFNSLQPLVLTCVSPFARAASDSPGVCRSKHVVGHVLGRE